MWSDGTNDYIAGYGTDPNTFVTNALLWTQPLKSVPEPSTLLSLLSLTLLALPRRLRPKNQFASIS